MVLCWASWAVLLRDCYRWYNRAMLEKGRTRARLPCRVIAKPVPRMLCATRKLGIVMKRMFRFSSLLVVAVSIAGGKGEATADTRVVETVQGKYGRLEVLELKGMRILTCDGVIQTAAPAAGADLLPGSLIRARDYVELVAFYRPRARTALLLGLGGGLHTRSLVCHGITVHAVDIEPAVMPLARKHFGFTGEATVADGREFLDRTDRRFDAIVLDVFQGGAVPKQLYTKEAFARMRQCLTDDGLLTVHLVSRPRHPATAAVAHTLTTVFPHIVALQSGLGNEIQHIYFLAAPSRLDLTSWQRLKLDAFGFTGDEFFTPDRKAGPLLTDRRTNLDELCRDLAAEHHRRSLDILRSPPW